MHGLKIFFIRAIDLQDLQRTRTKAVTVNDLKAFRRGKPILNCYGKLFCYIIYYFRKVYSKKNTSSFEKRFFFHSLFANFFMWSIRAIYLQRKWILFRHYLKPFSVWETNFESFIVMSPAIWALCACEGAWLRCTKENSFRICLWRLSFLLRKDGFRH